MSHQLVTIAFSHFCEKARWALERHGVDYHEHPTLPFLHFLAVAKHSRGQQGRADRASTSLSTPMLRTTDGSVLHDSTDILRWVDRNFASGTLYPTDEVAELEKHWGKTLGPDARRIAYSWLLPHPELVQEIARQNVSAAQYRVFRLSQPLAIRALTDLLKITPARTDRSIERAFSIADEVAERLSDGRPFLMGDRFSAADITFAALLSPLILPASYGAWMPAVDRLPKRGQELVDRMRTHPAGAFAMRMYDQQRLTSA